MKATTQNQDTELALRDWVTSNLASKVATEFDKSLAIECFPGYTGNNDEFELWLSQWDQGHLPEAFRRWLAGRDYKGIEGYAESDCGGGSEAVRWHPCGAVVVGVQVSDGHCWIIPGDETCPQVDNYEEPERHTDES